MKNNLTSEIETGAICVTKAWTSYKHLPVPLSFLTRTVSGTFPSTLKVATGGNPKVCTSVTKPMSKSSFSTKLYQEVYLVTKFTKILLTLTTAIYTQKGIVITVVYFC